MGKAIVPESVFPEIIEIYNQNGRTAAYDCLRSRYGIRSPYFVVDRIKRCGRYHYESDTDRFIPTGASTADDVFINLDDLCSTAVVKTKAVQEDSRRTDAFYTAARLGCTISERGIVQLPIRFLHERNGL